MLCSIIKMLCLPLQLMKGKTWLRARSFEENPRTMRFRDIVYFAYKYYYKSPQLPENDALLRHFREETPARAPIAQVLATVSIGGDLMPYEMIRPEYTKELWTSVGGDFFGSDLVFANLETPIDDEVASSFVPEVMLYDMHFNTDPQTMTVFNGGGAYKGYDVLSIANNHTLDQGLRGVDKTIEYLEKQGIRSVGARRKSSDAGFELMEVNGIKVGFLAYTYSLNQFTLPADAGWKVDLLPLNTENCDLTDLRTRVKQCREAGAELIICALHCGNAYQAYPSAQTVQLFERVFSECGVDVIAGGHPHNLQPWRSYAFIDPFDGRQKTGFAIYSLADFIAYDIYTWCHLCAYVKLELGRDAAGQVVFKPVVRPMVMLREDGHLRLEYAEQVFQQAHLSDDLKDMKILYDICMQNDESFRH